MSPEPLRIEEALFAQAALRPQAPAIESGAERLDYQALAARVRQGAHCLRAQGVQPGEVVGVCLKPSTDLVVALWAVLAAGAVFLPLDPHVPAARLAWMLVDAGARRALVHAATAGCLGAAAVECQRVEDWSRHEAVQEVACRPGAADALAYVMYTSGSTGQPKGVAVGHAALVNKIAHPGAWGVVTPATCGVLLGSIAFDAALAQIFLPLSHGGRLLVLDEAQRLAPQRFWAALVAAGVTVLDATPSLLQALLSAPPHAVPLQRIVLGGEVLSVALVQRLQQLWPRVRIVNAYGPTEACIDAAVYEVPAGYDGETVPIGSALPNYRLYLLDGEHRPVPPGEPATLWIAGPGLAQGYLGQPALTAQRFVPDPFVPGERMYATGDRVCRNRHGQIEFLGRLDQQVKLRGQRIELEEIDAVLQRCAGVQAAGVALQQRGGNARLVAGLVLPPGADAAGALAAVQAEAEAFLPGAMRPSLWRALPCLPLTPNGKLDRRALADALAQPQPMLQPLPISPLGSPADEIATGLRSIWAELLQAPGIGVDDNFFECGGDSLLAVEMAARVSQDLGIEMPAEMAMSHPTVAELAQALTQRREVGAGRLLLRLSGRAPHAGDAPLFCLPPLSGVGTVYARLARALSGVCPVQAFHLGALPPSDAALTMDALVQHLAGAVVMAQPCGPVRLLGYSAGGAVAHRLAQCLVQQGVAVSHLFLVDPYCAEEADLAGFEADPRQPEPHQAQQARFWEVCRDMVWEALGLKEAAADALMAWAQRWWQAGGPQGRAEGRCLPDLLHEAAGVLPPTMDLPLFNQLLLGADHTWQAYRSHRPTERAVLAEQVWMLQPEADPSDLRQCRLAQWQAAANAPLRALTVPGSHPRLLIDAASVQAIADGVRSAWQVARVAEAVPG